MTRRMGGGGWSRAAWGGLCLVLAAWPAAPAWADDAEAAEAEAGAEPAAAEQGDGGEQIPAARGFADVAVGMGLTSRSITAGSAQGRHVVEMGFVPALDLRLDMGWQDAPWRLALAVTYQSSLAADAFQPAPAGVGETTALRSHRVVGGLAGHWMWGGERHALGLFLGYGARAFYTVAELGVPAYTLHGPLVGLQLRVTLADRVEVFLAPEMQMLSGVSPALQNVAGLQAPGLAFGGEGGLRVRLWRAFALGVLYRQAHASFDATFPLGLADRERYLVLTGQLRWL